MARQCPVCGLFSPDNAGRCDCGWDFSRRRIEASYANPNDPTLAAQEGLTLIEVGSRNIKRGTRVIAGGVLGLVGLVVFAMLQPEPEFGAGIFVGLYLMLADIAAGTLLMLRGFNQKSKAQRG